MSSASATIGALVLLSGTLSLADMSGASLSQDVPDLGIEAQNELSRVRGQGWAPSRWLLVGAPSLKVSSGSGMAASAVTAELDREDSASFVGLRLEATRSFQADIRIYDNLGHYVNRIAFTVPPSEFSKLPLASDGRTRRLTVLWDNRSEDGHLVGTGSYVLKSSVSLLRLPGMAETTPSRTQYRRIGVIRHGQ